MKWITQNGDKLDIKDMSNSHIENCIKMLEKKLSNKPVEQQYMGESYIAEQAVENENRINDEIASDILDKINIFKKELERRI